MDFLNVVMKGRLHSLFYENFTQWMITFQNMVNLCDPNLRIFITRPYEIPMNADNEFFPDIPTSVKTVYQMSETERENYDLERKSFEAILECLPNDVASCYKTQETSFKLWKSLKNTYGSKLKGTNLEAGMKKEDANKASENKVDSKPSSCASCINLTNNSNLFKEESIRLNKAWENITIENEVLRANDKNSRDKLKAIMEEKKDLKAKIFEQQEDLCDYVDLVSKLKKQLFDSQTKVLNLNQKLSNFSCSSLVFDEIIQSKRYETTIEKGLGYHQVPPPKDYIHMPAPENLIDLTSILKKVDVKPVKAAVSISTSKPELVKAESNSAISVEEFVEVEDITEESTIKVEKKNVKPENFIITTENDERLKNKGKAKVDNGSLKVNNVKKDFKSKSLDNSQSPVKYPKKNKLVDKSENNKCSTSTSSTLGTSTSTCSPKSACSTNVPVNRPSVYCPPPKRFEGTHWNRSHVERRSCFHCGQQGHVIRDCKLVSLDRFGRVMPRTSYFRTSFSRRVSYSPVSSCASNSPKPMARVNKIVPSRPQVQKHNIVENKSFEPKQVWKPKSTNNTSMKSTEFLKYHKLIDVMIMDDIGQPKSIKAWVSHKI